MKKGKFLFLALALLAIGSVTALYAMFNASDTTTLDCGNCHAVESVARDLAAAYWQEDETQLWQYYLAQSGGCPRTRGNQSCRNRCRCGGSGGVPCRGGFLGSCTAFELGTSCAICSNTGRVACPCR